MKSFWYKRRKRRKKEIREIRKKKPEHNERLISNRIIDIRNLFEKEDEDYLKPKTTNNFWNNNYIEYKSSGDKTLSLNGNLNKTKTHLKNIIKDVQHSDVWKVTAAINSTSSKDTGEKREMYTTSDNVTFTSYTNVNDVVNELFESLLSRYQVNLETSMRESDFVFDSVQLMHFKCHRVTCKRGESDIDSPAWLKSKKATMNLQSGDNKCFQYAMTVALIKKKKKNRKKRKIIWK